MPHEYVEKLQRAYALSTAKHRIRARGAGSGIEMEIETWGVWTFDEAGLAIRIEAYLDHEAAKAREAAGVLE